MFKQIIRPASHGMSAGTALGFFWVLPATAERRGLYRFATDLGRLALKIADKHGSISEKWFDCLHGSIATHRTFFSRVRVLFCGLIAGFDQAHLGSHLELLGEAVRYGETVGDRYISSKFRDVLLKYAGYLPFLQRFIVCASDCTFVIIVRLHQGSVCSNLITSVSDLVVAADEVQSISTIVSNNKF